MEQYYRSSVTIAIQGVMRAFVVQLVASCRQRSRNMYPVAIFIHVKERVEVFTEHSSMKAILKKIDTNSSISLEQLRPEDPACFGIWLHASIGSDETKGADDFQIFVCNQEWLERTMRLQKQSPERFMLLSGKYDSDSVVKVLSKYLDSCTGNSWMDVVAQVSKIGIWEFEGYKQ